MQGLAQRSDPMGFRRLHHVAVLTALVACAVAQVSLGLTCYHKASEDATEVQLVDVDLSGGAKVCYRADVPASMPCPDLQCTGVPRVWVYSATDKATCDMMRQQQPPIGSYRHVSCCSTPQCNVPDPKLDPKVIVVKSSGSGGKPVASRSMMIAAGLFLAFCVAMLCQ